MKRTVLPVLAALAIVLSGCATADASQLPPTASATPSSAATTPAPAAATPAASPTPTPVAPTPAVTADSASAACDTILTEDALVELEEDGLTLNPDVFVLDDVMRSVMDDGFGCFWNRGGGDVRVWYAQAAHDADTWAERELELLDEGWTRIDGIVPGAIQAPTDNDNDYIPAMVHRDGSTYYVSYAEFLTAIVALQTA